MSIEKLTVMDNLSKAEKVREDLSTLALDIDKIRQSFDALSLPAHLRWEIDERLEKALKAIGDEMSYYDGKCDALVDLL